MFGARSRGAALATIALAVGAVLSGCVGSDPKPTSSPSATPLFSSDAEALAAAKASYQRYLDVLNRVSNEGWKATDELREVEKGRALAADLKASGTNSARGLHTTGGASFDKARIQEIRETSVSMYLCLDLSETRVLDSTGQDVTNPDRVDVLPVVATLESTNDTLVLSGSKKWDGDSFC